MKVDFCLKISIDSISSSNEIKRSDWRMMADLFSIDWTSLDKSLKGFPQDRVEYLFYIEVKNAITKSKSYAILESFKRIGIA
jgi:hypothetical protein